MRDDWIPETSLIYSDYLQDLNNKRGQNKSANKKVKSKRRSLPMAERKLILKKTGGKCHICGGEIENYWEADHVLAHSGGGSNEGDNYLPSHRLCNNYRWDYLPEEFQEILKLGVWLRTQIQSKTKVGLYSADKFLKYEHQRISRRKNK